MPKRKPIPIGAEVFYHSQANSPRHFGVVVELPPPAWVKGNRRYKIKVLWTNGKSVEPFTLKPHAVVLESQNGESEGGNCK